MTIMKKELISIMLMVLVSLTLGAQVSRHEIQVGNFSRFSLIDNINVVYRCNADSAGIAVIECTPEVLQGLMFNLNSNGRLTLQVDDVLEKQERSAKEYMPGCILRVKERRWSYDTAADG